MKTNMKSAAFLLALGLTTSLAAPVLAAPKLPPVTTENGISHSTSSASDAFPGLKGFLNLPAGERSQINVYYILRVKNCDSSQLHAILHDGGQTIPLRLAGDGRITPLPSREQLNGGATLELSGPATCTIGPKLHVFSTQPVGRTYDAAGLAQGVKQSNAAMGKIAGAASFLLKKLDRIYFVGGGAATVEVNGQHKPLPQTTGSGQYPAGTPYFVPSSFNGATKISLSATPSIALFDNSPN